MNSIGLWGECQAHLAALTSVPTIIFHKYPSSCKVVMPIKPNFFTTGCQTIYSASIIRQCCYRSGVSQRSQDVEIAEHQDKWPWTANPLT
jgi:hypothetical protein